MKRHIESKKHKELASGMTSQPTIAWSFSRSSMTDQVMVAEIFTNNNCVLQN